MTCPHCGQNLPDGLQACFYCGKPLQAAASLPPSQPYQQPYQNRAPRKRGKGWLIALLLALFVLLGAGGTVLGHYFGLFTLPLDFLPQQAAEAALGGEEDGGEPQEPWFKKASFTYHKRDDGVFDRMQSLLIEFNLGYDVPGPTLAELENIQLFRDDEPIAVALEEGNRTDRTDDREVYLFNFEEPFTEPGEYRMTFTFRGMECEVTGDSIGKVPQSSQAEPEWYNATSFVYRSNEDDVRTSIRGIALQLREGHGVTDEVTPYQLEDVQLFRDGEPLEAKFKEAVDRSENGNVFFFNFEEPFTAPGNYTMTFSFRGARCEVRDGDKIGTQRED
jgi:hypothetical protein